MGTTFSQFGGCCCCATSILASLVNVVVVVVSFLACSARLGDSRSLTRSFVRLCRYCCIRCRCRCRCRCCCFRFECCCYYFGGRLRLCCCCCLGCLCCCCRQQGSRYCFSLRCYRGRRVCAESARRLPRCSFARCRFERCWLPRVRASARSSPCGRRFQWAGQ